MSDRVFGWIFSMWTVLVLSLLAWASGWYGGHPWYGGLAAVLVFIAMVWLTDLAHFLHAAADICHNGARCCWESFITDQLITWIVAMYVTPRLPDGVIFTAHKDGGFRFEDPGRLEQIQQQRKTLV